MCDSLLVYGAVPSYRLERCLTAADSYRFRCSDLSGVLGRDELGDFADGDSLTLVSVLSLVNIPQMHIGKKRRTLV